MAPTTPPEISFVTAFGGIDRGEPAEVGWYKNLFAQSPFVFNGLYLSHWPTKTNVDSKWVDKNKGYSVIKAQGWGWNIYYVGYQAQKKDMKLPADLDTNDKLRAGGIDIGKRIKDFCYEMDQNLAGAVVIFDNEDAPQDPGGSLDDRTILYYKAMFEEMRQPGGTVKKEIPAVRPGFYSTLLQQPQMLAVFPDLFLWPTDPQRKYVLPDYIYDKKTKTGILQPPFKAVGDRIDFFNTWFRTKLVQVPGGASSVPLGKQGLYWSSDKKQKIYRYMPLNDLKGLPKRVDWDFDVSFVRDPRYPHGEPRFSVQGKNIVRGVFQKTDISMGATVTNFGGTTLQTPNALAGSLLEGEAPLSFLPAGEVFSIDQKGVIVSSKPTLDGKWTPFTAISTSPTPSASDTLRRMRAVHVEPRGTDAYLFYISKQFQFVTKRRIGGRTARWSDAAVMGPTSPKDGPHHLTNMAVTSTRQSIDVFFINAKGLLTATSPLLSSSSAFPAQKTQTLERQPSLLIGTALAAISPTDNFTLVFGVSRKLQLSMAVRQANNGWSALTTLGRAKDRVFAHSRLFAFVTAKDRATVYVGCITDANIPCVYTIRVQKTEKTQQWKFQDRKEYPKTSGPVPKNWQDPSPNGPLSEAFGYDINPFGDVRLFEDAQGVVLAVVGVSWTDGAVLMNHISSQGNWQRVK